MRTRKLGFSDLELTTVGLGTWAIGGPWQYGWGPQNDKDSLAAIFEAMDAGINWIDTAPIYGCGHSEKVLGRALKQITAKPILATKCGLLWDQKHRKVNCLKQDSIRKECENSLQRLGVEVIDLYQVHWPQPDEDLEECWTAIAKLIEQGKVRYPGVSNFNVEQIKRCQAIHPVASLQPPYNMITRDVEDELLGFCAENNIGVLAYSPLARGLLTGKFSHEWLANLPDDDHRKKNPEFAEPNFSATLELVEGLRPIAKRTGKTPAQLAITWVLRRPELTSAIVGARKPGQIGETAAATEMMLSDDDLREIDKLLTYRDNRIKNAK